MTERELDRRLQAWLVSREPGPVPDALRVRAARVPYEVRPGFGAMLDAVLAPWLPRPMARAGVVVLALLLLAALLAALVLVGSLRPDPRSLVSLSQETHQNPPAFAMTITVFDIPGDFAVYGGCNQIDETNVGRARLHYVYDGNRRFRYECGIGGALDTLYVDDGARYGYQSGRTWIQGASVASRRIALGGLPSDPLPPVPGKGPILEWLNWYDIGVLLPDLGRVPRAVAIDCASWTLGSRADVAGRPAWEVACGDDRYWIDEVSRLLVKRQIGDRLISEAVELEIGEVPAELFAAVAPAEVDLAVGQVAPEWTAPLLTTDGGTFSPVSLRGRPALVVLHPGCSYRSGPFTGCLPMNDFISVLRKRTDRLGAAAVIVPPLEVDRAMADAIATADIALVSDVGVTWRVAGRDLPGTPSLRLIRPVAVALGADGRVAALLDVWSRQALEAAIDAHLAGTPFPRPPAGDGVFVVGQAAPKLIAATADGTSVGLESIVGSPAIVFAPQPGAFGCTWEGSASEAWIALAAEARALIGSGVHFLAVDWAPTLTCLAQSTDAWGRIGGATAVGVWQGTSWGALLGPSDPGVHVERTAIVILDAEGIVRRVFSDELPSARELADAVAAILAGTP